MRTPWESAAAGNAAHEVAIGGMVTALQTIAAKVCCRPLQWTAAVTDEQGLSTFTLKGQIPGYRPFPSGELDRWVDLLGLQRKYRYNGQYFFSRAWPLARDDTDGTWRGLGPSPVDLDRPMEGHYFVVEVWPPGREDGSDSSTDRGIVGRGTAEPAKPPPQAPSATGLAGVAATTWHP
jgi:hypothetical protein